ncbi:cytochrome P450 [Nocardia abscessus]|jgi:cytochrome P450|uniref:cytochrome P450 n=1 Tax=Nocardia TaxID=1817 RepID=UPI00189300BF|nr:cytochrome P450 [Nocardia abscessus]MBF6472636.1 cytochrome P450 [Nocardia abscessus]
MTEFSPVTDFNSFDVFGAFEEAAGKARNETKDIYSVLRRYRKNSPVYAGDILTEEFETFSIAGIAASTVGKSVVSVFGYDEVAAVLKDPTVFSSEVYLPTLGQLHGRSFMMMDPPDHTFYRGLVKDAFARRIAETMRGEIVEPAISKLLDKLIAAGSADLVKDFALIFPVEVLHHFLGLRPENADEFLKLGVSSLLFGTHPEIAMAGAVRLHDLLREEVDERRAGKYSRPGLMQDLVDIEVDGRRLTSEEITPYFGTLLAAGAETAMRGTLNTMVALLTHPDQRAAVVANRNLLPKAVEETLRWEGPIVAVFRQAKADTSIAGIDVPAGTGVVAWVGSANHDDDVYTDPETFDLARSGRPHIGFGYGPHLCIGLHVARVEITAAVGMLLDRAPDIRLDPSFAAPEILGHSFRSPAELRVLF